MTKAQLLEQLATAPPLASRPINGPQGPVVRLDSREVVMLASNDYLGLAAHAEVRAACSQAAREHGAGMASVRVIAGEHVLHGALEAKLSALLGVEATALFPSCWTANEAVLLTFSRASGAGPPAIYSDELNHASIIDGIRLARAAVAGARSRRYAHADVGELARQLAADADSPGLQLIVTDGIFSMEGDVADLPGIVREAEDAEAMVMVDDSHGIGVIGTTGAGSCETLDLLGRIDLVTGTLGKALGGSIGGFVSGAQLLIDALRREARPYAFSNSLPPATVAGALAALAVLEREPERLVDVRRNSAYLRSGLEKLGFDVLPGDHPIVPVMIGSEDRALALSERLLDLGVYVRAVSFPMVPRGEARLRAQVSAAHTADHLDAALGAFATAN